MRRPLRTSTGAIEAAPLLLLDLQTDDDVTGHAYLFGIHPFTLAPLCSLVESLGGMVVGDRLAPFEIERKLRARLTLLGPHNLTGMALSGVDMAAWDALARARDMPLATLLGGRPAPVPAYNSNGLGSCRRPKWRRRRASWCRRAFEPSRSAWAGLLGPRTSRQRGQ